MENSLEMNLTEQNEKASQLLGGLEGLDLRFCEEPRLEVAFFVESGSSESIRKVVGELSLPGLNGVIALRRPHPFWYHPYMGDSLDVIPADPNHNFLEFQEGQERDTGEIQFLLWRRDDESYGVMIPLSNQDRRSFLRRNGETLEQIVRFDSPTSDSRSTLLVAQGDDPYQLVRYAAELISEEIPSFRLRNEKRLPEFADLFGWCTWDAFYKEVTAEKVESGLKAFAEGGAELGFLMIDDGWQQLKGFRFREFDTDKEKFPDGLSATVRMAKEKYGVGLVGVWHALQGYWHGVVSEGGVSERFKVVEAQSPSPYFEEWGEQFGPKARGFVHPDDIHRWYQEFYDYLADEGIDMVKVDNQAMLEFFTEGKVGNVASMKAYQQALQGASQTHFEGNLINCMSNTNDVAFHLSASGIWRNSDDFYPKKPASRQADHIVHNAYNNLWSSAFVWGDWDMFQTTHKHAEFHAMARAISGSPVYVSDKADAHDFEIIQKLALSGGRALRFADPAQPSSASLFVDPRTSETLLKVSNSSSGIGTVALFNCHSDDESEEDVLHSSVGDSVSIADVYQLSGDVHAFYAHAKGLMGLVRKSESLSISLDPMKSEIVTMSPVRNGVAAIGLIDKYTPAAAITDLDWITEGLLRVALKDGGAFAAYTGSKPKSVKVSGESQTFNWNADSGLLTVEVKGEGELDLDLMF
ncbi:Sip1-related alpha-galactosidase [Pelagicoccus mobilis]|uniref:Raffinose synthase n=1 Tax=Pelagicoccus mobilis TaxID=415221 RepID=A0A934S0G7_9BACT|nr:Sip1-related alpha-galactosidase [Pelagicoccus mobilis]MBK1878729.1 hypothetical protein [Pelagicoccus mobilis]